MFDSFTDGFSLFAARCYAGAAIAANALIVGLFALFLFLKNKRPYFFLGGAVTALECAVIFGAGKESAAVLFTALSLSAVCLFSAVLRMQRSADGKREEAKAREYVRTLESKLKAPVRTERAESALSAPQFSSDADVKKSLSLSHARSVIERLHFFDLSASDKNKLNELEFSLSAMEKDEVPLSAVNEKLSSLIRMLAKYGA